MALDGKRILVTGGTGGLGRYLVPELLDRGAWVAVTYRSNEQLAALFERVGRDGPQPTAVQCELTDADSVERLAEELRDDLPLHGIACLAGGWTGGTPFWEASGGELHEMMGRNMLPTHNVLRRFLPGMVEAGYGRVVTVGARAAERGTKHQAAYAAAKAAVVALTRGIAEDLHGTGAAAFSIMPSAMGVPGSPGAPAKVAQVPYEGVAKVVAWLLDEESSAMNGAVVPVFGD